MKQAACNQTSLAQQVGVHQSTISRERHCTGGQRGYRPKQAHALATARQHQRASAPAIAPSTWAMVENDLCQEWSPEQITALRLVATRTPTAGQ